MISLFLKSLLGAAAVVIIALLSKSKNFYIAGLVPLFPTFALIAHFIVGSERSMEDLRQTALFGLWSLLPYAAYLAAVYYFSYRFSLVTTLSAATVIWLMAASLLIVVWTKVMISV
ncbi:GlpM family protein [Vibrio vulnificus]|uniref:GlpM family protein n=1 Tax=Vibrio vulnificus TaxID=672 RepID=UPI00092874E1|nr:GlpM family protein [Vibrio vulnificus]EHK9047967.1 GlpM family protein [Vibrio vulnificus]EHU4974369.1 GlpM family protein [Vibrio vulnificus]EHU9470600.1 GlpM family protein [Vibrio vulnificus]EIO3975118.1 GlpM family protein [Vibrio vulnificus]EIO3976089.1 GlpM family protein [Vibrio vulnificus]